MSNLVQEVADAIHGWATEQRAAVEAIAVVRAHDAKATE